MTSMLDRPLKSRTFSPLSRRRRTANRVATVLVSLALLVAVAPLVMVLWSVTVKGVRAITSTVWWSHSQAGMTAFVTGGGAAMRWSAPCCRDWCAPPSPFRSV